MFEYMRPYLKVKTLKTSFDIGIINIISNKQTSIEDVCSELSLQKRDCELLLNILKTFDIIEIENNIISLSEKFAKDYSANPELIKHTLEYMNRVYKDMVNFSDIVQRKTSARNVRNFWIYGKGKNRDYSHFLSLITENQGFMLKNIYDFGKHHYILDLGGNDGTFLLQLCKKYENIRGGVFDLPEACEIGKEKFNDKIEFFPGDFFMDELPQKADLITIKSVLNDWSDEKVLIILDKVYNALPENGKILIMEHMTDESNKTNSFLFDLVFMYLIDPNTNFRSSNDYIQLLSRIGFRDINDRKTPFLEFHMIEATK